MPELDIKIGGRIFQVSCQPGEEAFLRAAAAILDAEAAPIASQAGRLPEAKLLLMAGLMLADRMGGAEEQLTRAARRVEELEARIADLENQPAPEPVSVEVVVEKVVEVAVEKIVEVPVETRVEVPVVPRLLVDHFARLAADAEAIAEAAEERAGALADAAFDDSSF